VVDDSCAGHGAADRSETGDDVEVRLRQGALILHHDPSARIRDLLVSLDTGHGMPSREMFSSRQGDDINATTRFLLRRTGIELWWLAGMRKRFDGR
jgi:hypothetical protein